MRPHHQATKTRVTSSAGPKDLWPTRTALPELFGVGLGTELSESQFLSRRQRLLVLGALVIVLRVLQVCCLFQRRWRIVPSSGKPNVGQCKLRNCWHIHCRRCCVPRLPSTAAGQEHERHRPRRRGDVSVPGVRIAALAFGNHPHSSRAIPKGTLKAVSTEFRLLKTDIVVTRAWFCGVTRRFSAAVR